MSKINTVFIVGPTASGKTSVSIDIAKKTFENYLKNLPNIIIGKVKTTKCFTLNTKDNEFTLFFINLPPI